MVWPCAPDLENIKLECICKDEAGGCAYVERI